MSDNSDYTKPRTNLYDLLPEVYKSGVNRSVLETTINRFLSKSQTDRVIGYVGQGNPNALINRQIAEPTPQRQAYQLQPMIYSKIGTVENMASWKDIENELVRLGVDPLLMQEWGDALSFNWAPPIDYDKLINYRNYYWYNESDPTEDPQYLTIRNNCVRAQAALDEAVPYAKQRKQFDKPIISFQAVQHLLADIAIGIESGRALVYAAAKHIEAYPKDMSKASSMCKVYATDVAMKATTDAVQVMGGYGYMCEYPVEKMMRDAKILQIYEGTNQIQRNVIGQELNKEYAK